MRTSGIKIAITRLIFLAIMGFGLSGCNTNPGISQQITSLNVGCNSKDVQISDETIELNGEQTWTAKCDGKTYSCTYFPELDTNCYELSE